MAYVQGQEVILVGQLSPFTVSLWGLNSVHQSWQQAPLHAEPFYQPQIQTSIEEFKLSRAPLQQTLSCLVYLLPVPAVLGSDFWGGRHQAPQEALLPLWDSFAGTKNPGEPQAVRSSKLPSCSSIPEFKCSTALHHLPSSALFRM